MEYTCDLKGEISSNVHICYFSTKQKGFSHTPKRAVMEAPQYIPHMKPVSEYTAYQCSHLCMLVSQSIDKRCNKEKETKLYVSGSRGKERKARFTCAYPKDIQHTLNYCATEMVQ